MKNIVLTGFMGAGKTLLSKHLSARLQREVVSTDDLIEKMEGKPITEIFREQGESYFRECEKKVVADIAQKEGVIVDCGGGIVLAAENIANLKKNGIVFYLSASPAVIYERIKDQTHRPLLQVEDPKAKIEELLEKRESFYNQADYVIDTNRDDWNQIAQEIVDIMAKETEGK